MTQATWVSRVIIMIPGAWDFNVEFIFVAAWAPTPMVGGDDDGDDSWFGGAMW